MNSDGIFQLKNKITFSAYCVLLIFILIYSIVLSLGPVVGGDVYFYLESGKNFIENGISLTPIDDYIFTRQNLPLELSHEWASMYGFYFFYMLGGWPLLYVVKTILVTATIYSPFLLSSRLNNNSLLIPVFSVVAIYASSFRFDFRTDLVSLILIVYLLTFIIILRRDNYKPGKWYFLLPIIFAVWVNLHPGFYIGLLVVGLSFVIDMYSYMRGENSKFKSNYISALAVFICSLFCCLLNPNGLKGFLYPMFLTVSNKAATIREYIPEWQSSLHNLDKPHVRIFLLLSVIYSVALFCHAYNKLIKKTIDIDDIYVIIISIFFILIGFLGVRYIAITSFCITVNFVYIIANNERSIILTKIYKLRYLITLTSIVFISLSVNDIVDIMSKINSVTNNYHAFYLQMSLQIILINTISIHHGCICTIATVLIWFGNGMEIKKYLFTVLSKILIYLEST
ncbi:MAG: hypothetical protein IPO45_15235 [Saprospiraceae bacterium]|nr:hypothetical protein [Candidatus Brachybacter algidus]